jgi:hypothetical protein
LRILLDECVPRRLKKHFRSYGVVLTVTDAGLSSYTNGQLLRRISGDFDVFITIDKAFNISRIRQPSMSHSCFCVRAATTSQTLSLWFLVSSHAGLM